MFGDNPLLFQTTIKKPKNNRIVIPSKTGVEPGECLVLYSEEKYLSIYSLKVYRQIIMEYKKIIKSLRMKNLSIDRKKHELDCIYFNIYDNNIVDNDNRIILPKIVVNKYDFSDELYVLGAFDHLELFKDENTFENYKKYVKEKRS